MPHYVITTGDGKTAVVRMTRPPTPDEKATFRRMFAAADDLIERIATCHERVACPRCGAPVGQRCRALPKNVRATKHPHDERWRQETPAR